MQGKRAGVICWEGFPMRERSSLNRLWRYAGVIHHAAGPYPSLFYPLHALRHGGRVPEAVARDTELVIEGFPRSGNTFALLGFRLAQGREVKTADHLHVPAQIVRAAEWGIPACVVIRDPEAVVRSLVVKYPYLEPRHVLLGYASFYERCLPLRDKFVAATFEQATCDLGAVIDRINARFGTAFKRFEHTPANERRVFAALDSRNLSVNGQDGEALSSYRPNGAKEMAKRGVRLEGCERELERCRALWAAYRDLAADPVRPRGTSPRILHFRRSPRHRPSRSTG
jgi:hypothetical protein